MNIRPGFWVILAILVGGIGYGIKWYLMDSGKVFQKTNYKAMTITKVDLPNAPKNADAAVLPFTAPSSSAVSAAPDATILSWAWSSNIGFILANGGDYTTKGSLMDQQHVVVKMARQDDVPTMRQQMVKFAQDYKNNGLRSALDGQGACGVIIMGDGGPNFLYAVNQELAKLGTTTITDKSGNKKTVSYKAKVVASFGKSVGEDGFWAPAEVAQNPEKARGLVVACVELDGDWNIVALWAAQNNIPVNKDDRVYDPDAINFVNTGSYIDAANKVINGYREKRAKVKNNIIVDKEYEITVNACATWTPGDVTLSREKGGLVKVASTKQNSAQMAGTLIVIDRWAQENKDKLAKIILAGCQGGDQVKSYSEALTTACDLAAAYFKEPTPKTGVKTDADDPAKGAYWKSLFNGKTIVDKTGNPVECGGSKVDNLADNLIYFGIGNGQANIYKSIYNTFGDLGVQTYPSQLPSYPAFDEIFDGQYLVAAKALVPDEKLASADVHTYEQAPITNVVSRRDYQINFEFGSADIAQNSYGELDKIADQLTVSEGLKIALRGHTDNVGKDQANVDLSQRRAQSVYQYLHSKNAALFPQGRFSEIVGYGSKRPKADNSTDAGRAANRRVEIVLGE
jgi:outer membrane protein OmpA-like peptidoglycan-associated protein